MSAVRIDPGKPIVAQVGALREHYVEWAHQPVGGRPRLFGPDWLEFFSKTPWFCVPLIWVPIALAALGYSYADAGLGMASPAIAWRALLGVFTWQLVEYSLHRFVFHLEPVVPWKVTLHFLTHGCHHKYPHDDLRLVFPLLPASVIALTAVAALRCLLPWSDAAPFAGGLIVGYVAYDCSHYFVHAGTFKANPFFAVLRKFHMDHHFLDHSTGYGISSSFWDHVWGTTGKEHSLLCGR